MFMFMNLLVMRRMFMLVGAVLSGVIMVMNMRIPHMRMFVRMFMEMLMGVNMGMLMQMHYFAMPVLMAVDMRVFMGM
jgi:hypothetical protein|uniref:Uncharacterized protein n=1 Tax=Desulfobacca acetoxidans TaxID=60893 RepID=A0A7C3SIE5_9BACT